jgi:hypothetical protein
MTRAEKSRSAFDSDEAASKRPTNARIGIGASSAGKRRVLDLSCAASTQHPAGHEYQTREPQGRRGPARHGPHRDRESGDTWKQQEAIPRRVPPTTSRGALHLSHRSAPSRRIPSLDGHRSTTWLPNVSEPRATSTRASHTLNLTAPLRRAPPRRAMRHRSPYRALLQRDKVKRDTDALKSRADATRAEVDERLGRTNVILDEAQPPTVIRNTPNSLQRLIALDIPRPMVSTPPWPSTWAMAT